MTYEDNLKSWAIVRLLPPAQWVVIGRYRSRSDAEGHLQLCRQQVENIKFEVVFDPPHGVG